METQNLMGNVVTLCYECGTTYSYKCNSCQSRRQLKRYHESKDELIFCEPCNVMIRKVSYKQHQRTQKHQNNLSNYMVGRIRETNFIMEQSRIRDATQHLALPQNEPQVLPPELFMETNRSQNNW